MVILFVIRWWLLLGALNWLLACGPSTPAPREWVARYGDQFLTAQEFQVYCEQQALRNPRLQLTPAQKQDLLEKLIEKKLLLSEAEKLGLANEPACRRELEEMRQQILIKNLITRQAAVLENQVKLTPEEIRSYYENLGQEIQFHYLRAATPEQAEELLGRWTKGQEPEGLLDSGPVKLATLDEHWRKLQELPVQQPQIIKIGANLVLVQVLKKVECQPLPFDAVKEQIVQELKERHQKELLSQWVEQLKNQARVEVNRSYDWR
jgi:hypothetical protein